MDKEDTQEYDIGCFQSVCGFFLSVSAELKINYHTTVAVCRPSLSFSLMIISIITL